MVLGYNGTLNRYFDYAIGYGIKSIREHPSWTESGWIKQELYDADVIPVVIPPYQRKLVWEGDDVEKIVKSSGRLLGTITFAAEKKMQEKTFYVLVDGLQRFSTITAIFRSLWNNSLSENPTYPGTKTYFSKLLNEIKPSAPIICEHNHEMLLKSARTGIRTSYDRLANEVNQYIESELKNSLTVAEFAQNITRLLLDKMIAIDVYDGFENNLEVIDTFRDINSSGVKLDNTDLLRADIILQSENLGWGDNDMTEGENRFTLTLQPESDSKFNKNFRNILGLRLYQAQKANEKNIFPDWDKLELKSLMILFDYIDKVEEAQNNKISNSEYRWPYLEEIFRCGALPFIAFIWFFYQNHYLKFLEKRNDVAQILNEKFTKDEESKNNGNSNEEQEDLQKRIKIKVTESLEKLENAKEKIEELNSKLAVESISENKRMKLENEKKLYEELHDEFRDFYKDLPDFLGGSLDTTEDGLLFLRASYRRLMDGSIGTTAPIVDRLMNKEIKTIDELSKQFNPEQSAGLLQNKPNEDWLRGRLLAKEGTTMAKIYFSAMQLPDRDSGRTDFGVFVYGSRTGQWNIDHLIPGTYIKTGEGKTEGNKIVNFAPLDKEHNLIAQNTDCSEKISDTGVIYSKIKDEHEYCKWLVEEHFDKHKNDLLVNDVHPLDKQECLVHNHASKIGDERLEKILQLLIPKI